MLSRERVLELFREAGVLLEGHFILTSGKHSNRYLQCAKLFRNTRYSEEVCASLAERFAGMDIRAVVGPAMGAVQMAYEVSRHIGCENFFTERDENGKAVLRRGFEVEPGKAYVVVEDVVTTGGSAKEVVELIQQQGGIVAGVGVVVDRSNGKADFGVPLYSVIEFEVTAWEKEDCPLCREGALPAVKPGSRKTK